MLIHDITIEAGAIRSRRQKDTVELRPAAVEVFRDLLERHGEHFRVPLPVRGLEHLELHWDQYGAGAPATFWSRGAPITTSALASGHDAADDWAVLAALHDLMLQFFRDSPFEPSFVLLDVAERPLLATLPIPAPTICPDIGIIADAETCLAAAFFLWLEM